MTNVPGLPASAWRLCGNFDGNHAADKRGGTGDLEEVKDMRGKFAKALNLPKAMFEQRRSGLEA